MAASGGRASDIIVAQATAPGRSTMAVVRASGAKILGGDVCGAWSPPRYARRKQKFAASFDRPKLPPVDEKKAREVNTRSLAILWPALTGA